MRVRAFLDSYDVSGAILIDSVQIEQDSTQAISTAAAAFVQVYGEARYDNATYDHASYRYTWTAQEWSQFVLSDQDTGQILFAGYVLSVQRRTEGPHVRIDLQASDWGILFERAVMTEVWPAGTLDSTIIEDCLAAVPQLGRGTIVTQIADIGEFAVKDQRVRDVLDQVCQLTGGEWNVSYDGKLNYYRSGSIVAPFILSDQPAGPDNEPFSLDDYQNDFTDAANRVLVLGAIDDISEVRETAEDLSSQQQYGVLSVTLVNREIYDPAMAQLLAESEIEERAWPKVTIKASYYRPGLTRGMTVEIVAVKYGLSGSLLLRTLAIAIAAPDRTRQPAGHVLKYTATLGWRPPDLVYSLRRMQRNPLQPTIVADTPVAPGSITEGDLAAGLELVHVVDALPVPPPPDWSATALAVIAGDPFHKLYRRTGNTWTLVVDADSIQGQLQTSQLAPGSVTSTVLADGSVVTAKIPAGAIGAPQLAASSVTANAIAANAIYAQALQANSVTAIALAANSVVAGKIAALAVIAGTIAADAVTAGTITAGAVRAGNLAAGAVTAGTIASGSIRAQDAVFQTGAIQSADIQSLTGDKITAHSITSDKLSALEIAVGYGGDKPGRVGVYSQSGLFAVLGDMGASGLPAGNYWGIWAKVAAFGGSGYSDSKMYTDLVGNMFLRNVSLTISASDGSTIVTSPTTFDSSYANALAITNTKPGDSQSNLISRGLVIRNSIGTAIGALVRNPSSMTCDLVLYSLAGAFSVLIEGASGIVRATGFQVGGNPGFTGQVPAGRAINVQGGMITGYV